MLKILDRLGGPPSFAVPYVSVTPSNKLGLGQPLYALIESALLAPRPTVGTQANMIYMWPNTLEWALSVLNFHNCQVRAAIKDVFDPVTIMSIRRFPSEWIEACG
jgi:hypothetical protein